MNELLAEMEESFRQYRRDIEEFERKRRPMDGLLGFGRTLSGDACNDRLDGRTADIAARMCSAGPEPGEAERAVRLLLLELDTDDWPEEARWMLRAVQRHAAGLIPFLAPETAAALGRAYGERYRRWERLPAQQAIFKALRERG